MHKYYTVYTIAIAFEFDLTNLLSAIIIIIILLQISYFKRLTKEHEIHYYFVIWLPFNLYVVTNH